MNFLHKNPTFVLIHQLYLSFQKSLSRIKSYSNYSIKLNFMILKDDDVDYDNGDDDNNDEDNENIV